MPLGTVGGGGTVLRASIGGFTVHRKNGGEMVVLFSGEHGIWGGGGIGGFTVVMLSKLRTKLIQLSLSAKYSFN